MKRSGTSLSLKHYNESTRNSIVQKIVVQSCLKKVQKELLKTAAAAAKKKYDAHSKSKSASFRIDAQEAPGYKQR